jgi:LuxR family maltose regulon positive regulatory protein
MMTIPPMYDLSFHSKDTPGTARLPFTRTISNQCTLALPAQMEPDTMELVQEKIAIPTDRSRISRARLLQTLELSLGSCSATILSGRAGTGKTALALDFASRSTRTVAWFKVDASDADWHIFFEYLSASVRNQRPNFGLNYFAEVSESATLEDMQLCAEAFVFELLEQNGAPLLIVLEDLHLVYDAEWVVPFFARLLPLLPHDVHLLITCRSMPPAPLWRMRSKQTLYVVEETSLAFTIDEAKELYRSYGLTASEALIAFEETRGRASVLDSVARVLSRTRLETLREGDARPDVSNISKLSAIHTFVS